MGCVRHIVLLFSTADNKEKKVWLDNKATKPNTAATRHIVLRQILLKMAQALFPLREVLWDKREVAQDRPGAEHRFYPLHLMAWQGRQSAPEQTQHLNSHSQIMMAK